MAMMSSALTGCGGDDKKEASNKGSKDGNYEEFITVDVFDAFANYQGIQSGWFAKVVKDKFNMELNIIAPNVAGGGDTLYQTRSAKRRFRRLGSDWQYRRCIAGLCHIRTSDGLYRIDGRQGYCF